MPAPVRSRSLTRPTDSPRRRASSSVRRAFLERDDVDADPAAGVAEPALERRVGDGLHRRRHAAGRRGAATYTTGSSIAPKCIPTMISGAARRAGPRGPRRASRSSIRVERGREVVAARPRDLEVVADRVPEAAPDEALQRRRGRWPRAGRRRAPRPVAARPSQTRRRFARAWAARAGATRYQSSPTLSAAATSGPLGQRGEEPRGQRDERSAAAERGGAFPGRRRS